MDDYNIVYRNPVHPHPDMPEIEHEVNEWLESGENIISDGSAQAIASWWHSPGSPQSTILSTMGGVTDDMCIEDFAGAAEYLLAETEFDRDCLDALKAYIYDRQTNPFL